MRIRLLLAVVGLVAAACAGGETTSEPSTVERAPTSTTTTTTAQTTTSEAVDTRPVWAGFQATREETPTLVAYARGPLIVYDDPAAAEPMMTVEPTTILGTETVLGVVTGPDDGWVEVMLPTRPNGSTGWARADQLSFYVADSKIVVELGARRLTYLVDGVEILSTEVGVGSKYNETPTGEFFVTDSVTLANPNSPWGPHAFGLSARSDTVTEFNGGDGIIGIHGTNNPTSIGANISLGCVRLPNDVITTLYKLVPIGTRVEIRA